MKAIWNDEVIAESNETIIVEGNHYFPPFSVKRNFLSDSSFKTTCPWKGEASYYSIEVGERINLDAAWYYPNPKDKAAEIKNYIAFWKEVVIKD